MVEYGVVLGDDAVDRFAEKRDVGGGPRQPRVQAERHMAFENEHPRKSLWRQAHELAVRPAKVTWVDREDPRRRVFPLDDAVESGAAAFWQVKKNDGAIGRRIVHCAG